MNLIKTVLFFTISLIYGTDLEAIEIINKSIDRFNNIDIEFKSNIKQQSIIDEPISYNLDFKAYWPIKDSLFYYNYIKFNDPVDYKDIEIWLKYYNDTILVKKRLPIDNKITSVDKDTDNNEIINLFNFSELYNSIKDKNFSIKDSKINNKEIFYIKAYSDKSKKKSIRIYIDKVTYAIYKIEWSDKRGKINKSIIFDDWIIINEIDFSSQIIYEDKKNDLKFTCKLDNVKLNEINDSDINKIKSGFSLD